MAASPAADLASEDADNVELLQLNAAGSSTADPYLDGGEEERGPEEREGETSLHDGEVTSVGIGNVLSGGEGKS